MKRRFEAEFKGLAISWLTLFLCLRDGSGLNQYRHDPPRHLPFSIFLSTILVPGRGRVPVTFW